MDTAAVRALGSLFAPYVGTLIRRMLTGASDANEKSELDTAQNGEALKSEVRGLRAAPEPIERRTTYFLNRFSNAVRASFGRRLAGVDVSFSRVTRISKSEHSLRASFFAMRSLTGCMHSKRLPGSK